ncbi:hypothetical protein D8Y22_06800 [Salinadaptatus halalkaliphilus]|uniref:Uncharacterized protein n=1 Tax=Salinadaptatus halalkaliphilus TaxID=2419781 RepID=A0A4S3TQU6_9EURY|nr:hypothetical protein [Salinadaptatus halalkaliphilus]THE65635.1 hypothetical protein D8Y22_06800 [Salinadaptatus halalkaliphilus]
MVLHFREATSVYRQTLPYVLLQLAIGVVFGILGVIYLSLVGWLGYRFFVGGGGWSLLIVGGVMLVGLVSFALVWRLIQKHFLYMIKTGHVAVIAHIVEEGEVPDNQISYGMRQVKEYFVEATALWTVSMVVDAVLKQFNRAVARIQDMIPLPIPPQLQTLIAVAQKSIGLAVRYLDNAIIAYMFVDRNDNRWRSARDGLVLYGKTWKTVLGSTLLIVIGMYVLSFVLLALLAPLAVALDFLPTSLELVSWLLVGGMVAIVHTGVVKPWVKTVVVTTFLIEQRDEEPDSETMEWIADRSDRFGEVLEKADADESLVDEPSEPETPDTPTDPGSDPADD